MREHHENHDAGCRLDMTEDQYLYSVVFDCREAADHLRWDMWIRGMSGPPLPTREGGV